ncbi:MAG: hypothetical protein ACXWGS_10500 [Solirubrobacterales bacterium]
MNLHYLRLARVDPYIRQDRHEALAERIELLLRVPDLADAEVAIRTEADVIVQPIWGPLSLSQASDAFVVLLCGQGCWGKADQNAHCEAPSIGCERPYPTICPLAVFEAFELEILYDKAGRTDEISATVSDAFEKQKALPKEGSLVVLREVAGAGFEPAT